MRSRVIPGSSPTIERRLFVNRLNSVDLPTLGRPTMATNGSASAPGRARDYRSAIRWQSVLQTKDSSSSLPFGDTEPHLEQILHLGLSRYRPKPSQSA